MSRKTSHVRCESLKARKERVLRVSEGSQCTRSLSSGYFNTLTYCPGTKHATAAGGGGLLKPLNTSLARQVHKHNTMITQAPRAVRQTRRLQQKYLVA
ncbi:hypothetical protein E2C01_045074 [Portunus trituberculatus]|uniref:Uncharacterized protein n=1 Tax=Portunus trituberculatus TaxID=210409 RepID=A0A5B7FTS4_PORTR|nr:hypothetical protein [Portunus trituberculatus]